MRITKSKTVTSTMKFFVTTLLAGLIFCGAANAATTVIMGHVMPTDHVFHQISEKFMDRAQELSGNAFNFQYHPAGALGDWASQVDQTMAGALHINFGWALSELDPRLDISNFGFIAEDWDMAKKIYGKGGALDDLYQNMYNHLGLTSLGTIPTGFTGFVVRKGLTPPVNIPADAKGFKMRVPPFPMGISRYQALGFSVVPMAFSEVYTALQTGAIDGRAYSPLSEVMMFRDVLEAYVYTKEHFEQTFFFCNTAWLSSLPEKEHKAILQAADEVIDWSWAASKKSNEDWRKKIEDSGLKIIELTKDQHDTYKQTVLETEIPLVEKMIGKDKMAEILNIAGIKR